MSNTNNNNCNANHPRTTAGLQTKPKPKPEIEWNDKDITAYTDIGLEAPKHLGMYERKFLSQVDISKGRMERTVRSMIRLKAPDYLSNANKSVPKRKEYIYYTEYREGVDWRSIPANPVNHTVGLYTKQYKRPHIMKQVR